MGDSRRDSQRHRHQQQGSDYYQHGGRGGGAPPRCSSKRPPPSGNLPPTVPSWEKEFCYHVGRIPWRRILEAKNLMPVYKNIVQWDDLAGEEAFHNAKARYWAHINDRPCDIPVPDPDMYIDEIDWNLKVDPELILELEKESPPPPPTSNDELNSGHLQSGWDSCIAIEKIVPTGWESTEDPQPTGWVSTEDPHPAPGWEDWERKDDIGNNRWDCSAGWDDGALHNSSGGSKEDKSWARWENFGGSKNVSQQKQHNWKAGADHHYLESKRYNKKREGNNIGWYGPGYTNSRYKGGDNGQYSNNRNCRGRRKMNYNNERSKDDKEPQASWQWNSLHSCGPRDQQQVSSEAHGAWPSQYREKPVS